MVIRLTALAEPKVSVERAFDVTCEELYDAWVRPERLTRWFVPEHYLAAAAECTIEPEPGGHWSLGMADPDSEERAEIVTILTQVRPAELLAGATTAVTRVGQLREVGLKIRFTPEGGASRLQLRQGPFASLDQAQAISDFWSEAFFRLGDHLKGDTADVSPRLAEPA